MNWLRLQPLARSFVMVKNAVSHSYTSLFFLSEDDKLATLAFSVVAFLYNSVLVCAALVTESDKRLWCYAYVSPQRLSMEMYM